MSPRCHKMHGQGRWQWMWDKWDCSDMGKNKILKAWPGIRTISHPVSIAAFSLTQTPGFRLSRESKTREAMWIICLSSGKQGKTPLEAGIVQTHLHFPWAGIIPCYQCWSRKSGKL